MKIICQRKQLKNQKPKLERNRETPKKGKKVIKTDHAFTLDVLICYFLAISAFHETNVTRRVLNEQ
jgi:hypothetical protein